MQLLLGLILISLAIGLSILAIKTSNISKITNVTSNLINSSQNTNTYLSDIDDCGSSQYIKYMKQFTPEQHQAEMNREVKEIWENITYANLDD